MFLVLAEVRPPGRRHGLTLKIPVRALVLADQQTLLANPIAHLLEHDHDMAQRSLVADLRPGRAGVQAAFDPSHAAAPAHKRCRVNDADAKSPSSRVFRGLSQL